MELGSLQGKRRGAVNTAKKPLIRRPDALRQPNCGAPPQGREPADIQQLAWSAVGFRAIEDELPFETDRALDERGKFGDSNVLAGTDIHDSRLVVAEHEMYGGGCKIVDVQELAPR